RLEVELDAECLLAFRHDLSAQQLIGSRHEIGPAQPVQSGRLAIGRRPPRSEDRGDPAAARGNGAGPRKLQKSPPIEARHDLSSLQLSAMYSTHQGRVVYHGRGRMSDAKGINVLAICGSLRAGLYNRAALRTAIELRPPGMTIETADISAFPLYNEDVRAQGFPPPVETLRRQISAADALLFVTPEYNSSMSGVLKNAIDWASRPPDQPFAGKPVAIMGAAAGMAGSA